MIYSALDSSTFAPMFLPGSDTQYVALPISLPSGTPISGFSDERIFSHYDVPLLCVAFLNKDMYARNILSNFLVLTSASPFHLLPSFTSLNHGGLHMSADKEDITQVFRIPRIL